MSPLGDYRRRQANLSVIIPTFSAVDYSGMMHATEDCLFVFWRDRFDPLLRLTDQARLSQSEECISLILRLLTATFNHWSVCK